ncbi:metal-dependent hydrolase [Halovivax sp.]|uniref:metal-dependent hydrolase n=1 Tax=Halovivax sp. TaxID=1935978 RepID=UPI0025C60AD8|nr:metal-dependent hydrolase [Halovivax sp.]
MMATTHAFAGVTIAAAVALLAPELALVAAVAAIWGGVFPDLDLYAGHRKTLHFPVYYSAGAALTAPAALLAPSTATVALAVFLAAAALHCVSDALGGGLEPRPWEATSERAVYDHVRGRWIRPRRWVAYDGSPGDLALAAVLALPGLLVFDGRVHDLLVVLLVVSIGYAVVRKPLPAVAERLLGRLPPTVVASLPAELRAFSDDDRDRR